MPGVDSKVQRQPPWEADGDASLVSFGAWLRRQREAREVSLRDISEVTKIGVRYLEALENDRFDILPAPVFVKGFLKEYSRFVGLDADEVVNSYLNFHQDPAETADDEDSEQLGRGGSGAWASGVVIGLAGVLILSAVAFIAFYAERSRSKSSSDVAGDRATSVQQSGPVAALEPNSGRPPGSLESARPIESQAPVDSAPGSGPRATTSASLGTAGPLRVTLDFTEDCWVEIVLDQRNRISELRVQGESLQLSAQSSVRLTLGNPGGVRIEVNGVPYPVEFRQGRVARDILIDLNSLATGGDQTP